MLPQTKRNLPRNDSDGGIKTVINMLHTFKTKGK